MAFVQSSKNRVKKGFFALDPRTKLLMLLIVSFLLFLINDLYFMLILLGLQTLVVFIARIDLRKFIRYIKPTFWLIPTIFIMQLFFSSAAPGDTISIAADFGLFSSLFPTDTPTIVLEKEAIILATNSCLRILNLAIASCLFSLTTNSNDYLQSLTKIFVPFELAFTTGLVIYFLPMVVSETNETQMALETRGISVRRGSFLSRLRNLRILVSAILINFIEKSKYQAIALESRGFNASRKRTYYRTVKFRIIDIILSLIVIGLFIVICYYFREEITFFFTGFWSSN